MYLNLPKWVEVMDSNDRSADEYNDVEHPIEIKEEILDIDNEPNEVRTLFVWMRSINSLFLSLLI